MADMPTWLLVLNTLVGAGLLAYAKEVVVHFMKRKREKSPAGQATASLGEAQKSLLVVAAARDELVEDNQRLAAENLQLRQARADDEAYWRERVRVLREEVAGLERQLHDFQRQVRTLSLELRRVQEEADGPEPLPAP